MKHVLYHCEKMLPLAPKFTKIELVPKHRELTTTSTKHGGTNIEHCHGQLTALVFFLLADFQ